MGAPIFVGGRGTQARKGGSIRQVLLIVALSMVGCGQSERASARHGRVYLVPFGDVPEAEVQRAEWALRGATEREVVSLPRLPLPMADAEGRQDAGRLLDALLLAAPPDAWRIAGVTRAPLRATEYDSVIGYARRGERALVYSTDALPAVTTEAAHRRRVRRIVAHELGHTHGATHCDGRCVLADIASSWNIDVLPDHYCPRHRALAAEALGMGPSQPEALVRRGAEQLRLGHWDQSVAAYRGALRAWPDDPRIRTSLGVALMARGEWLAAEQAFVDASNSAPQAPQPYYGRAVLYAAGPQAHRAPAFIEAAVSRDGDALRAHRAAGILYEDVLEDEAGAVRHYHAHLRLGGRDPRVIERLVKIMAPTTLVFTEPELVIARWQPGRGLVLASNGR